MIANAMLASGVVHQCAANENQARAFMTALRELGDQLFAPTLNIKTRFSFSKGSPDLPENAAVILTARG